MALPSHVWYASYGSNLSRERFLTYITGGRSAGARKVQVGCRDAALPLADAPLRAPHRLLFAFESSIWGGGVCFLDPTPHKTDYTLLRAYLITREQFADVLKQENDLDPHVNTGELIDMHELLVERRACLLPEGVSTGWYRRVVCLGTRAAGCGAVHGEFPIVTFTHADVTALPLNAPSAIYLSKLADGMANAHGLARGDVMRHLVATCARIGLHVDEHTLECAMDTAGVQTGANATDGESA